MPLVCAENFFVCAQLDQKLFLKKTNFQSQWAAGEMKIQNDPIASKIVSIVYAAIFLVCAAPLFKLGAKNPRLLSEISK